MIANSAGAYDVDIYTSVSKPGYSTVVVTIDNGKRCKINVKDSELDKVEDILVNCVNKLENK